MKTKDYYSSHKIASSASFGT